MMADATVFFAGGGRGWFRRANQALIEVGAADYRCSGAVDGGTRGRHHLDEGVGNEVRTQVWTVGAQEPSTAAPTGVVTLLKALAMKFVLLPKLLRGNPRPDPGRTLAAPDVALLLGGNV